MTSLPAELMHNTAGLLLTSPDGTEVLIDPEIMRKSEYLQTVLDCDVEGAEKPLVVVSSDVLSSWLAFVQQPDHNQANWMSMESLEAVLKAADVLIDETTTAEVAHLIAERLFPLMPPTPSALAHKASHQSFESLDSLESAPPSPQPNAEKPLSRGRKIGKNVRRLFAKVIGNTTPRHCGSALPGTPSSLRSDHAEFDPVENEAAHASEILDRVSEDLALSILHAAPNVSTLLATLPRKLHPLALRAQNPSIDSHHSLVFHFREISAAVPAARAATSLPHITSLSFNAVRIPNCHQIPQAAAGAAAVFRSVAEMPRLSSLTLKGWILDLDGELALSQQLQQPRFGDGRLRHLALSHLRVSMNVLAPALAPLAPSLTCLDLSHTLLSASAAHSLSHYLGDLRELRRLHLGFTHIGDSGWAEIAPPLGRLRALETLDVSNVHVRGARLFQADPDDSVFSRGDSTASSESGQLPVGGMGEVAGEGTGSGSHGETCKVDGMWLRLRALDLSHNRQLRHLLDIGDRLACMTNLRHLNCAGMGLFGEHAVDALRALSVLELQTVDLSYNDLNAAAWQLCSCLQRGWRGLTSLTLTRTEIRIKAAEVLAESLTCLQGLQELHLPRNGLAGRGAVALAPAIGALRALRVLNLAHNEFGDVGAHSVAAQASVLLHLEVLDVSFNGICGFGAAAIADAVAVLPAVRQVSLQGNAVGDEGVAALAVALRRCGGCSPESVGGHGVRREFRVWGNAIGELKSASLQAAAPAAVTLVCEEW